MRPPHGRLVCPQHAGVAYDGNDPRYRDLYHEPHEENAEQYPQHPSKAWKRSWFNRVKDLIDQHRPDLVDGAVFGEQGRRLLAHYYSARPYGSRVWARRRIS